MFMVLDMLKVRIDKRGIHHEAIIPLQEKPMNFKNAIVGDI